MFKSLRRAIGSALANFAGWMGAYDSANPRRKILELWKAQKATANQALGYVLPTLVNQCRQLERNCPSARAAAEGLVADIVGTGIDVAPDTGSGPRDEKIKKVWQDWCESAAVDGSSLWELQAQAVRECYSAGGALWRKVVLPERLKEGKLPFAILPLEVEWLSANPVDNVPAGHTFVNGIEVDRLGRTVAYHLADPNLVDIKGERVPASQIIHCFEKRRPGQAVGEPWMAPVIERLKQEEDLVKVELQAAQIAANLAVAITSEYHEDSVSDDEDTAESTDAVVDLSPGTVTRLYPGEDAKIIQSSRPNQQIAPFRDMMRGDLAGALRVSRKWLNRDYSSATFMNTRMEQNDASRQHKATQNWLARHVASQPYLEVLPYIFLRLGIAMPEDPVAAAKFKAHRIMPDLPEYVDPVKDGQAAIQNIGGGLTTLEEECSRRGKDYQQIIEQHLRETEEADAATVRRIASLNKAISAAKATDPDLSLDWSQVVTLAGATSAPGAYLDAVASAQMSESSGNESGNATGQDEAKPDPDKAKAEPEPEKKAEAA